MEFANTQYGKFHYFPNDDIGRRIAGGEFFDSHLKPWMDALKEGDVLVDVGANIGFFTIYAAKRGAIAIAFEPSREVFSLLQKNVEENGVQDNVALYNQALYDKQVRLRVNPAWQVPKKENGEIDYDNCENSGGLSLIPAEDLDGIYNFFSITLDDFGMEQLNLLKVDTQGSDYRVLLGARKTIERCQPVVCFEFEHDGSGLNANGDSLQDFLEFFEEADYAVRKIADGMFGSDYVAVPA